MNCPVCGEYFTSEENLDRHAKRHQTGLEQYQGGDSNAM